ncbi:carbon dioxide concentrating mechanism protein [Pleurocapsales cyanobacterium LEGE 10410]|nr:carbon dioxide concentrating mechanism protein [Pleurocapsales cyanobacterium LEGE 10410]
MYLPPPQPILNQDIRVSGDVEIHPTASLAPGVILQAAPDSSIVIGADVCIGMGVIINAHQGAIEIESGAILGSGVLIIGKSKIGKNACVGTSTTVFHQDIAAMVVIEPGSIIGDISRKIVSEDQRNTKDNNDNSQFSEKPPQNNSKASDNNFATQANQSVKQDFVQEQNSTIPHVETSAETQPKKSKPPVVGQVYINELLITLFPHNKSQNNHSSNP